MTPEQENLVLALVGHPGRPGFLTPSEFLEAFGTRDGRRLASDLLENAARAGDVDGVELAAIVGSAFGAEGRSLPVLCTLLSEKWHRAHEDLVSLVADFHDASSVEALYGATVWVPEHLAFDDSRALAVKAIWALAGIPGPEAEAALERIGLSDSDILRRNARERLAARTPPGTSTLP